MTGRHKAALIIFGLGIALMIFAMLMAKWGIWPLTVMLLATGVALATIAQQFGVGPF
jgi:uncharacterized ion transporter superfamily protein YfcC